MTKLTHIPKITLSAPDIVLIDSVKRIQYNGSLWHSIVHWKEKRRLNAEMWQAVSSFLQDRYQIEEPSDFKRVWKEISEKKWSLTSPLTVLKLREIDEAFKKHLVYHGPGIAPIPGTLNHSNEAVHQVVQALLHGGNVTSDLIQIPLLRAVLMKKDEAWLGLFRAELQLELDHLAKNPPKSESEEILWREFLGHLIAFLPFSYPPENTMIRIPCLDDQRNCRLVEFKTQVIELTGSHTTTPISAVGLIPKEGSKASPILSFLGTTYPAGDGFAATLLADFTPNMSVGESVYFEGKAKIDAWMNGKQNVHLVGASLGGALAFHTLMDHRSKLSRVDTYKPPGLSKNSWNKHTFDDGPLVNIYCQPGDIVTRMGFWPIGNQVKLFNILPHQEGVSERMPHSHAIAFSGCRKVTFIRCDPKEQNNKFSRKFLTFLHRFLGPLIFYFPTLFLIQCYRVTLAAKRCWDHCWHK